MTKKNEGKPRRLSVKKQAVKTGGGGGKRLGNGSNPRRKPPHKKPKR